MASTSKEIIWEVTPDQRRILITTEYVIYKEGRMYIKPIWSDTSYKIVIKNE